MILFALLLMAADLTANQAADVALCKSEAAGRVPACRRLVTDGSVPVLYRAHAWHNLGGTKQAATDYRGAIKDFDQAIALDPQYAHAYHRRGLARWDLNDFQGALADLDQAVSLEKLDLTPRVDRGGLKLMMGDTAGAAADLDAAMRLSGGTPSVLLARAGVYILVGDFEKAAKDYVAVTRKEPDNAAAWLGLGKALSDMGLYGPAEPPLDRAVLLKPSAYSFASRGIARDQIGKHREAVADFNASLALNPKAAAIIYDRGLAYAWLGEDELAMADYNTAIALSHFSAVFAARAALLTKAGNDRRAKRDLDAALALTPDWENPLLQRAALYMRAGKRALAEKDCKHADESASESKARAAVDGSAVCAAFR